MTIEQLRSDIEVLRHQHSYQSAFATLVLAADEIDRLNSRVAELEFALERVREMAKGHATNAELFAAIDAALEQQT